MERFLSFIHKIYGEKWPEQTKDRLIVSYFTLVQQIELSSCLVQMQFTYDLWC